MFCFHHCACVSVKQTQPKLFKVAPSIWGDFEQKAISQLEKTFEFFLSEQQQSVTWRNQADVSAYPWTRWEKITFDQSFVSKHQIFSFEICLLGKKQGQWLWGHFKNFEVGEGTETFSVQSETQTSCDVAVL